MGLFNSAIPVIFSCFASGRLRARSGTVLGCGTRNECDGGLKLELKSPRSHGIVKNERLWQRVLKMWDAKSLPTRARNEIPILSNSSLPS
jgi:hypothetical protein